MGIEFAPLDIPLARRLQTLAAWWYFFVIIIIGLGPITIIALVYILLFTKYYWLGLIYAAFWYGERGIQERGGRPSKWVRNWACWRYFRDYFPIKIVKTVDLDPSKNYLFCSYPHGVLCAGVFSCFGTEALDISKVLPGITVYSMTLPQNFNRPVFRDMILGLGCCASSTKSISHVVSKPGGGNAALLVVGGAAEALNSKPRTYKIILKNRKGFIKIALRNGASLVPVFSFGETDLYDQIEVPWLSRVQTIFRKVTGIAPVIMMGRGFFQYSFGIIPKRTPVTTVIGKPIQVERIAEPTSDQVDSLHQQFMDSLMSLFETEKHKYIENADDIILEIN